jgi:HNH endonuclease
VAYDSNRKPFQSGATPPRPGDIKHYSAIWKCIYCGESDASQLTDEHIIPLSLGGALILDKASCYKCNKITKAFERTIARTMFGPFRVKHNIKTRHKKERPSHFEIGIIDASGRRRWIKVSAKDYHASTFIYKFTKPKILLGLPPTISTLDWTICIHSSEDLNKFKKKYNWDGMVSLITTPFEFARLLAKIAHSYTIAELGQDSFCPLVVKIILGNTNDIGYYIGGKYDFVTSIVDDLEPPIDVGHLLGISYQTAVTNGKMRIFIVVQVRLFASLANATYQVVVGEIKSEQQIRLFAQQCIDARSE